MVIFLFFCSWVVADPDIGTVASDLDVPKVTDGEPAAGKRVRVVREAFAGTELYHSLYLPINWEKGKQYPVIVEYAGNGPYRNKFGDVSDGRLEGCMLGYGVTGGRDAIWVCLPFVAADGKGQQRQWWGSVEKSVAYCIEAVGETCRDYGGDPKRVILAGFSRGAIACNYIGLHNDEIARLWCGFICHSHYDGVRKWGYSGSDRKSAATRLARLGDRPQWISQERSVGQTQAYLKEAMPEGDFTFVRMPYRNHTAEWTLKPIPERERIRKWFDEVVR
jgi:hypothetical protein